LFCFVHAHVQSPVSSEIWVKKNILVASVETLQVLVRVSGTKDIVNQRSHHMTHIDRTGDKKR
jgi:hypothetical protein